MQACVFLWRLCMLGERRNSAENTKRLVRVVQAFHAALAQPVGYYQPASKVQYPTENPIFCTVVRSDRAAQSSSIRTGKTCGNHATHGLPCQSKGKTCRSMDSTLAKIVHSAYGRRRTPRTRNPLYPFTTFTMEIPPFAAMLTVSASAGSGRELYYADRSQRGSYSLSNWYPLLHRHLFAIFLPFPKIA